MQPVVFDDCAGWFHPARGPHGVVFCNAFGYDELCTHRAWLQLAEELAARHMPVLRFDYPGTGDSLGMEEDPGRIDAWIGSIVAACHALRAVTGVERVSLCGFRLGATLAALAAERLADVDSLVLLAPVLSGRKYVRELHAHRQRWLSARPGIVLNAMQEGGRTAEAFGFALHGDEVDRLAAVDLLAQTTAPARRVLLLNTNERSGGDALAARYREHGVEVDSEVFDELDPFLVEARLSKLPVRAFTTVCAWLARGVDAQASERASGAYHGDGLAFDGFYADADADAAQAHAASLAPELAGAHFVEQPVTLGASFGVYCRPRLAHGFAPAVLIPNTAANHHIGDGRCFVLFARRLAALGIASLRMDLPGLGDSAPGDAPVTLDSLHSPQACAEVMAGADWLVAQGHARVVTFGICSGAFVGLHACAVHPQIVGSFGVNLQQFVWEGEQHAKRDGGLASNRTLRRVALSAEKWKRVLTGKASLARTARGLSGRARRRVERRLADLLDAALGWSFSPNGARRLLDCLDGKGAEVRLLYGEFDRGIDELKLQFGTTLRGLRKFGRVRVAMLPILDHSLFTRTAREAALGDAQQWLLERFCGQPGADAAAPTEREQATTTAPAPAPAAD